MSSTMVVTMTSPLTRTTTLTTTTTADSEPSSIAATDMTASTTLSSCPSCGDSLPSVEQTQADLVQAQARIADLEAQVRMLNQNAAAAVDRWADYEDELSKLRSSRKDGPPPPPPPKNEYQYQQQQQQTAASLGRSQSLLQSSTNRLSQFLSRSRTVPSSLQAPDYRPGSSGGGPLSSTTTTTEDLLEALNREQSLRKEAEGQLKATSQEVEELSATLFEQANEMVADERRARAKLEERVGELEKRDSDKIRRLETLEKAMARIQRVRTLLDE